MTQQQSYPSAEIPVLDLQPLPLQPVPTGGSVVTYQALIEIAPAMPEFSVKVKAASPRNPQEERELQNLLDNMRARFMLIGLGPDEGPHERPDSDPGSEWFDPDTEILIQLGLTGPVAINQTFGVMMVLQTAVDGGTEAEAHQAPPAAHGPYDTVPKGRDHLYTASRSMWAAVTSSSGSGSVRWPESLVRAGYGPGYAYGKAVWVHGNTYMIYTISAGWTNRGLT